MDVTSDMDNLTFCDYCIVCDRAIAPPKEPEVVKTVKKKAPAGTIRIKNPDGTVTTRTANGQKTTRPPLRRGPHSANRLAAVVAANNNAAAKFQPLTRSKTAEPTASDPVIGENATTPTSSSSKMDSPETTVIKTPSSTTSEPPYISGIYCSRACAQIEQTRSSDFARRLSYDMGSPSSLRLITTGLPMSSTSSGEHRKSPMAPPSPLFISGSDTSSHSDPQSANPNNAASSAPNANGFSLFNLSRDGADDAWRDVNKQRRSSVHPTVAVRPVAMARQASQISTSSAVYQSSDSLNSLYQAENGDVYLGRSTSGSGRMRMTPMSEYPPNLSVNENRRSMSTSGDRSAAVPVRPLARSSLSQASLTATPVDSPIPPEFGSYPEQTLSLWNSYHNAFGHRDSTGTGTSASSRRASKSAAHGSGILGTTPKSPARSHSQANLVPHPHPERRSSSSAGQCGGLQRPLNGTIRAKSRTDVTWDSFGRDEVLAHKARQERLSGVRQSPSDHTPKQSIEVGQKGCMIRYYSSSPCGLPTRSSAASIHSPDLEDNTPHPGALAIPTVNHGAAYNSISPARTPTKMLPPTTVPNLASLRANSGGCAMAAASAYPFAGAGNDLGLSTSVNSASTSVPRSTWNWDKWEKEGGRTYEVPKGLKQSTGKAGLFFFK